MSSSMSLRHEPPIWYLSIRYINFLKIHFNIEHSEPHAIIDDLFNTSKIYTGHIHTIMY